MTTYTERGIHELTASLREAKTLLIRRADHLSAEIAAKEQEVTALRKIGASLEAAIEIMQRERSRQE